MTDQEIIDVVSARVNGRVTQFRYRDRDVHQDDWLNYDPHPGIGWDFSRFEYRVKPELQVAYLNVYCRQGFDKLHFSREVADREGDESRLACVRIEYTEGQYDE